MRYSGVGVSRFAADMRDVAAMQVRVKQAGMRQICKAKFGV